MTIHLNICETEEEYVKVNYNKLHKLANKINWMDAANDTDPNNAMNCLIKNTQILIEKSSKKIKARIKMDIEKFG